MAGAIFEGPVKGEIRRREHTYRIALAWSDALATTLALTVAIFLLGRDYVSGLTLLAIPMVVVAAKILGLYDRDELLLRKTTLDETPQLFQLATICTLVFWLGESVFVSGELGHDQVLGLWIALFTFAIVGRWLTRAVVSRTTREERCLVVGGSDAAVEIDRKLGTAHSVNAVLVGTVPLDEGHDHRRTLRRVEQAIADRDVHRVILAPRQAESEYVLDMVRTVKSLGVRVSLLPRMFEVVGSSVVFDELDGVTVLGVRNFGMSRSSLMIKRTMDLVGASLGLLVISPLLAVLAAAVRLDSSGPILFRQVRVGRNGETFEVMKFRTMVENAEELKDGLRDQNEAGALFKIEDDPRITRVGRILRKTSLDELPQLFNVFRGEMSLVGPRPLVLDEDSKIEGWRRRRLHLTPGMTGHWQILGSSRIPMQEMVKIDYLYVANWSLWTDVKILLRTVPHMLRRGGM
ncbi:MAG: sugar transferase [Solirubrobacteraceae bacterium]|nr:sugar transferase [Solirubrobacteraceae bacterium]